MNFYDVLNVHLAWKLRLRECVLDNNAEHLDPGQVGRDDSCELGRWISSQYAAKKDSPEFMKVRELHADFHRCAAEIVQAVNQGSTHDANNMLQTEYLHLSAMLVKSLTKLNKVVAEVVRENEAA
jgi:hypothetical protein